MFEQLIKNPVYLHIKNKYLESPKIILNDCLITFDHYRKPKLNILRQGYASSYDKIKEFCRSRWDDIPIDINVVAYDGTSFENFQYNLANKLTSCYCWIIEIPSEVSIDLVSYRSISDKQPECAVIYELPIKFSPEEKEGFITESIKRIKASNVSLF